MLGSQQWQWWGLAMAAETEAVVGAHKNLPTNGSSMAAATAFVVAAAVTALDVISFSLSRTGADTLLLLCVYGEQWGARARGASTVF